jgi:hypothetical protein
MHRDYQVDSDGNKFVDYLEAMKGYKDKEVIYKDKIGYVGDSYDFVRILDDHKRYILDNIKSKDMRIEQKYRWCKNYHNTFCSQYPEYQNLIIK